jgi:hypothetical protein
MLQRKTLENFCKTLDLKKAKLPLLPLEQPQQLQQRLLLLHNQHLELPLQQQLLVQQQLQHLLLFQLNYQSYKRPLTLLLLETNKVTEYQEITFQLNFAIKPNSLNYSLRKLNLHRSCNKDNSHIISVFQTV